MTAKEKVLQKYPNAVSTKINSITDSYWLIWRNRNDSMYIGYGSTEEIAWRNTSKKIENQQL